MATQMPPGLTHAQAAQLLQRDGHNELDVDQRRTLWRIALAVVREPMFMLLLGASAIYLIAGDAHEALILMGFVLVIMVITALQERRTENALAALRDLTSPRALVLRDGQSTRIAGREVVVGDVLLLAEGDRVAADGVVLQAHELACDESMLTGEAEAVAKFADGVQVFAGTLVVRGQGVVRVTAIGAHTELGRIGRSLQEVGFSVSPMRDEVAHLTRRLAMLGGILCALLAGVYVLLLGGWLDALLAGITLAMGILPQEFPVIMIVFLALGARRIAAQRVLTRRLDAIETLGETTVLCVDKTGTLTQNRMQVAAWATPEHTYALTSAADPASFPAWAHELLEYAVLASETAPHDPMEQAFHALAATHLAQSDHQHPDWRLVREYELSPQLLSMSHLWRGHTSGHDVVAAKGAPEAVVELCGLTPALRELALQQAQRLAEQGLRVLAIAKATHPADQDWPESQRGFLYTWLGLVGLNDPLRDEVPAAVDECHQAGVRVVMITGDHPRTARAVAGAAGLPAGAPLLTGAELAQLPAAELAVRIQQVGIFARVSPKQKLDIVQGLQASGAVVAMTGDGVNDAPALKAAHIGIAMGRRGTDVAREAAAMVLLDDDFGAIVAAIRLGRRVFANLRQALIYTLAVHVPIIGLSVLPLLLGLPIILAPIHIAFLELVIDPACSIVFEAEPGADNLMRQAPRAREESLLSRRHLWLSLALGTLTTVVVILAYRYWIGSGVNTSQARALAFILLVMSNVALILACRPDRGGWRSAWAHLPHMSLVVVGVTVIGLMLITFWAPAATVFAFAPPAPAVASVAFGVGLAMFLGFHLIKLSIGR